MNKWWRTIFFKGIIICCMVACTIGIGINTTRILEYTAYQIALQNAYYDGVEDPSFLMYQAYETILDYHIRYQSEDMIKSGELVTDSELAEVKTKLQNEYSSELLTIEAKHTSDLELLSRAFEKDSEEYIEKEKEIENDYYLSLEKYNSKIDAQINAYKASIIRKQLSSFNEVKDMYNNLIKNYQYIIYMVDGSYYTNVSDEDLEKGNAYFSSFSLNDDYSLQYVNPMIGGYFVMDTPENVSEVKIAMTNEYYDSFTEMTDTTGLYLDDPIFCNYVYLALIEAAGVLLCLLYLLIVAGRNSKDNDLHLSFNDYIYTDLYTIMYFAVVGVIVLVGGSIIDISLYRHIEINNGTYYIFICLCVILMLVTTTYLTTLSKRIKNHTLFSYTCFASFMRWLFRIMGLSIHKYVDLNTDVKKQIDRLLLVYSTFVWLIIGFACYVFLRSTQESFFLALIIAASNGLALRVFLYHYIEDLAQIKMGVDIISCGDLNYQIPPLKNYSLNSIGDSINSIRDGLKESVKEQVDSEKTKIELITNISHDLKTPLTSIISYVDLLKKTNNEDEKAHYIEILDLKSHQLKKLVEDLFEITKVQNGQVDINLETLCIDDLIQQILAEFNEDFEKKQLQIRFNPLEIKTYVFADGNKMNRVISNIIGNMIKYTMPNTRGYIEFEKEKSMLYVTFKNISNYEMDFNPSDMLKRFNRGDSSRGSEGNGLGLSIAESFMVLQNGTLDVSTDGDLFKIRIGIPMIDVKPIG